MLAPVDFDLSFEAVGFFSPYTGAYDQSLFDSWLNSEHVELERAVAGETANTGLTMALTQVSARFAVMCSNIGNEKVTVASERCECSRTHTHTHTHTHTLI